MNKIIHYFFEGKPGHSYVENWKSFQHDSTFMLWNSTNIPHEEFPALVPYIEGKRWSVLSDFVRRWAIHKYGGIYLDIDVELIKNIDDLFGVNFVCIEGYPVYANTAVCGGVAGNEYSKWMLDRYFEAITGRVKRNKPLEPYLGCDITTKLVTMLTGEPLSERHLKDVTLCFNKGLSDEMDSIDNIIKTTPGKSSGLYTLPKEYFFPFNWNEKFNKSCITQNTRGIHWWKKGW